MTRDVLEKDSTLQFPHVLILKASAGSGKTYSLTKRYVQFLLSDRIPQNHLRNILAITFSNNAAKEMKERILSWLKDIYFNLAEKVEEVSEIISLGQEHLLKKVEITIEGILKNYSEFQVKTIDSFMTSIYKASAIHLGYSPDFEIHMNPEEVMTYAFNRFLRGVREKTREAKFLEELIEIILEGKGGESTFPWNPSKDILNEIMGLYHQLSGIVKETREVSFREEIESIKEEIRNRAEGLNSLIEKSNLTRSQGSSFFKILEAVKKGNYPDLIEKGLLNPPVIKPKKGEGENEFERIFEQWNLLTRSIKGYIEYYSKTYYLPYLTIYEAFKDHLEEVKRREGVIFIQDVNKKLSEYLHREIVPDVYFRIGDTIYHYLIDEFQDTSPIQWANLFPLIENSLSQGGSLFAVGDTKQAIYGFRNADYEIMRGLELNNPFPSALHQVRELDLNYRSQNDVVEFSQTFFRKIASDQEKYGKPARQSGLIDFEQRIAKGEKGSGYVEIIQCVSKDEESPEKEKIQRLVKDLIQRGYPYSDIAILTYRNEDVVNLTTWLNEIDIPFVSYSNLDIRTRKLTAEIIALLTFLDAPLDPLSFAGFILGEIFRKALESNGQTLELKTIHEFLFRNRRKVPLYKAFQEHYPKLWEIYFESLFNSVGYLPLYDLVNEIYRIYKVFNHFRQEEATLIKLLEVIKDFEGKGRNNPSDFLRDAFDPNLESLNWTLDIPAGIDAIKVITIHKAKGLGFPVVIMLLYEETPRGFKYILNEEKGGVHLLKINQQIMKASEILHEKYEEAKMRDWVDRLNTLYVGFTRAEDELYVIGVQRKARQFPIDLLKNINSPVGSPGHPRSRPSQLEQEVLNPSHPLNPLRFPSIPMNELNLLERLVSEEERKRGEFIHRSLYFIDYIDESIGERLDKIIQQVNEEMGMEMDIEAIKKNLLEFLGLEDLRPYFQYKPGRVIQREQDVVDSFGNLFRMDRVVIDEDEVCIIDFKTGKNKESEKDYTSQIKNYVRILKEIFPEKKIEGLIAYYDLKKTVKI